MNAVTVCVDMDDLLAITLPLNAHHFQHVLVVTAPHDHQTRKIVQKVANASCHATDAFYRNDASFNKGLAIEEALDLLGRTGWLAAVDADILLPPTLHYQELNQQCLYGAHRAILSDPKRYSRALDWNTLPTVPDGEIPGCFQLFHPNAEPLQSLPWFGIDWKHAGGYDSVFEAKFRPHNTRWLYDKILHLGPVGVNWCGRVTPRLDGAPIQNRQAHQNALQNLFAARRTNDKDAERL